MTVFNNARPEAMGVTSTSIMQLIDQLHQLGIPMHSLLISRHGSLIAEGYYKPYKKDTLHRMFSVSKSITSIAIGQLIDSGRLRLEDKILNYFPEYLPESIHPFLEAMTIEDLLTMKTCHTSTTYKADPTTDWVGSFFRTIPTHRPGTVFNYDTSASHTLCALVEKITGKPLLDYLRDNFLSQVGFSDEAYMLNDPYGHGLGGSGLMAKPMDLMVFATLIFKNGKVNNRQILSSDYIQKALSHHSDTLINGGTPFEKQGYGYQFWLLDHKAYACFGMGGQLAICLPEHDLIVVTTADTQGIQGGHQLIYKCIIDTLIPHLSPSPLVANLATYHQLSEKLKTLEIQPLTTNTSSPYMNDPTMMTFHLDSNDSGFTYLTLSLNPNTQEGQLTLILHQEAIEVPFGFGKMVPSNFPIYDQKCVSSAQWLSSNTLYIKSHIIDECLGSVHFHLHIKDKHLSLTMRKIEETNFNEFTGYISGHFKKA